MFSSSSCTLLFLLFLKRLTACSFFFFLDHHSRGRAVQQRPGNSCDKSGPAVAVRQRFDDRQSVLSLSRPGSRRVNVEAATRCKSIVMERREYEVQATLEYVLLNAPALCSAGYTNRDLPGMSIVVRFEHERNRYFCFADLISSVR